MKYDCGITKPGRLPTFGYRIPKNKQLEFAVLALTPGIPRAFLLRLFNINPRDERHIRRAVRRHKEEAKRLAMENAASITLDDGWAMAVRLARLKKPRYVRPLPHWAALAVSERIKRTSVRAVAKELGFHKMRAHRWRLSYYHPLLITPLPTFPDAKRAHYQYYLWEGDHKPYFPAWN